MTSTDIIKRLPPCIIRSIGGLGDIDGDGWVSTRDVEIAKKIASGAISLKELTRMQQKRGKVTTKYPINSQENVDAIERYVQGQATTFDAVSLYADEQMLVSLTLDLAASADVKSGDVLSGVAHVRLDEASDSAISTGVVHLVQILASGSYESIGYEWFSNLEPGATIDVTLSGCIVGEGEQKVAAVLHGTNIADIKTVTVHPQPYMAEIGVILTPKAAAHLWGEPLQGVITVYNNKISTNPAHGTVTLTYRPVGSEIDTVIGTYTFDDLEPGACEVFTYATQVWDDVTEIDIRVNVDGNCRAATQERVTFTVPPMRKSPESRDAGWIGDFDNDGAISLEDVRAAYLSMVDRGVTLTDEQVRRLDINESGEIELEDCSLILKYYQGKISGPFTINESEVVRQSDMRIALLPQKRTFARGESGIFIARVNNDIESNVMVRGKVVLECKLARDQVADVDGFEENETDDAEPFYWHTLAMNEFADLNPGESADVAFILDFDDDQVTEYGVFVEGTDVMDREAIRFVDGGDLPYELIERVNLNAGKDASITSAHVVRRGSKLRVEGTILMHRCIDAIELDLLIDDEQIWSKVLPVSEYGVGDVVEFKTDAVSVSPKQIRGKVNLVLKRA